MMKEYLSTCFNLRLIYSRWLNLAPYIGFIVFSLVLVGCGSDQDAPKSPSVALKSPLSNANEKSEVTLTVTASDQDGSIASYAWKQISGPVIELTDASSASLTFMAPEVTEDTKATLSVTVTDNDGLTSTETLDFMIVNLQEYPRVLLAETISVGAETSFSLTTNASDDGEIISYEWNQISGVPLELAGTSEATLTIDAPNVPVDEIAVISVTVTDNEGLTTTENIEVTIVSENKAPTVLIVDTLKIKGEQSRIVTAVAYDEDGEVASYNWSQVSGMPLGLEGVNGKSLNISAPPVTGQQGAILSLTVTDKEGATTTKQIEVTIIPSALPNIVNISPDFGIAGTQIVVTTDEFIPTNSQIFLNGLAVNADNFSGSELTFTIPVGASSGALRLVSGNEGSNSVFFDVSSNGLIAPTQQGIIVDHLGTEIVSDYVLVAILEESSNEVEADRLAALVNGEVIGRIEELNIWQIRVDADSIPELEAFVATLEADNIVRYGIIDFNIQEESINWSKDPDRPLQRDLNRVEEGAELYASKISNSPSSNQLLPFFMAIGISEDGIDFDIADFDKYLKREKSSSNINIYAKDVSGDEAEHGNQVSGLVLAELGDGGNAGLISALRDSHAGANIDIGRKSSSVANIVEKTLSQIRAGATVINWSWGFIKNGTRDCVSINLSNGLSNELFTSSKRQLEDFFQILQRKYPNVVVVASAGNYRFSINESNYSHTSSDSGQIIVVGAHTTDGTISNKGDIFTGKEYANNIGLCPSDDIEAATVRAHYSNFGEEVDITASGSIMGFRNEQHTDLHTINGIEYSNSGTSYSAPLVTATVALMQSINPNLTPIQIKNILRSSALPISNQVKLVLGGTDVVTRPLTVEESAEHVGMGARLNVEGAIQAAIDSRESETLTKGDLVTIDLGGIKTSVTQTIEVVIPDNSPVFDKVDIMFIVDVSGSYSDDLITFRSKAISLVDAFESAGQDVHLGISSFSDFPIAPHGSWVDYPFRLDQALTGQQDLVIDAINNLSILSGGDFRESQLEAIYQTADDNTGWRNGALPVMFLATDASFHNSDINMSYPGAGFSETLDRLNESNITVFGLQSGGAISDVNTLVNATGGEALLLSRDSTEVVESVLSALGTASSNLTVKMEPSGDFYDIVESIVPLGVNVSNDGTSITGVNPGDRIKFDVTFKRSIIDIFGDESHTITLRLLVNANNVAIIQEIPVLINFD